MAGDRARTASGGVGKIMRCHVNDEAVIDAGRQYVDAKKLDMSGEWKAPGTPRRAIASKCRRSRSADWNDARSERRHEGEAR